MDDKNTLLAVLQYLEKHNLKGTVDLLRKEANLGDETPSSQCPPSDSDVSSMLAAYKSEGDPEKYEEAYTDLKKFVEGALDIYKYELGMILYPVLVHMYLELLFNNHEDQAKRLMEKFGSDQEDYFQDDLKKLSHVCKKDHLNGNELTDTFTKNEFIIRMSRDTLSILKRHLAEKKHSVVQNIIQEHLYLDMYEGVARNKQQIDATSGAMIGEASRADNKARVYYGLLKEPDVSNAALEEEDEEEEGGDKPKKKKSKKDHLYPKKSKSDPNAPPVDRMPLPELKEAEIREKVKAMRDSLKRVNLGPETLPSVCFYTLLNANQSVTCAEISEDSSLLAVGFNDSFIKVWSLVPQKLRSMKSADQLSDIDREAEDVLARMMDDRSSEVCRTLLGHSGPVYRVAFSPDRQLLLSCSEDSSIRLWSLLTWSCVVCYKGHTYPVWDVRFSQHGYYFATGGHDKTARLWATDQHQPLRIFAGHYSDVDCVQFHPNSNYIATGSSDRTVRLWDCVTGNQVRLMTGHKGQVLCLCFSVEGRFLASAGADSRVLLWDLAHGHLLAELCGHTASVLSLAFSREGSVLVSGSTDCTLKIWDFTKLAEAIALEDVNISHNPDIKKDSNTFLLRTYATKNSPIVNLHFTRRNLLLAVGLYDSQS
ncbi:Transcription initiation factor TFIID subunit 5 [Frankliniella fusca]|uniref:Transcription initiation factor TFIID subunit 5 n=1 Tax=Frankliniella fusca TaxID=407009 RepID=A0AAE1LMR8_9NEOP|nr:Transcription initiation factor TFIID subunit 5 [Frankliniella fusca]